MTHNTSRPPRAANSSCHLERMEERRAQAASDRRDRSAAGVARRNAHNAALRQQAKERRAAGALWARIARQLAGVDAAAGAMWDGIAARFAANDGAALPSAA